MSEFKVGDLVTSICRIVDIDVEDKELPYLVEFEPGGRRWLSAVQLAAPAATPDVLAPGDLVELKSQSQRMTVVSVAGASVSVVYTQYGAGFRDYGGPRIADRTFPAVVLKKVGAP